MTHKQWRSSIQKITPNRKVVMLSLMGFTIYVVPLAGLEPAHPKSNRF